MRVDQRPAEFLGFDLEAVAGRRLDAIGDRQRRGAEEVNVQVARPAGTGDT